MPITVADKSKWTLWSFYTANSLQPSRYKLYVVIKVCMLLVLPYMPLLCIATLLIHVSVKAVSSNVFFNVVPGCLNSTCISVVIIIVQSTFPEEDQSDCERATTSEVIASEESSVSISDGSLPSKRCESSVQV